MGKNTSVSLTHYLHQLLVTFKQIFLGMHDIIGTLLVSDNISFKIKYWILASMPISANMTTDKIIGCCFLD